MLQLKPSQEVAMNELIALIQAGEKRIVLEGPAGSGKTFMTNAFIKVLKTTLYSYGGVTVAAPTHKALSVLFTKIDSEGKDYLHFKTIHSALKLTRKIDFRTGKESFVPAKYNPNDPPFKGQIFCIVDEGSMLGTELLFGPGGIHEYPGLTFLFIGDRKQLPPVGEAESPIFTQGWPIVSLSTIIRQGEGSPIIELSNNLSLIKTMQPSFISTGDGYFHEADKHIIVDKLAQVNGTDEMKYLAYTNIDVNGMNADIRRRIYGNPAKVEKNESLIFTAPYVVSKTVAYNNNQEIKVEEVKKITTVLHVPTPENEVVYSDGVAELGKKHLADQIEVDIYIVNDDIKIIHENSEAKFKSVVAELVAGCKGGRIKWPLKYWFEEQLAGISYNHALTVHKSQGSTYGTAILNIQNINFNRNLEEKHKMLYTAITRASNKVALHGARGLIL